MRFEESIKSGFAKETKKDIIRAKSLIKSSKEAIETANNITLDEKSLKSVFRESYEGFRQYCEAVGYIKGYKFLSHEAISYFLKDKLNEDKISYIFNRYRKLRDGINYYGESVTKETVLEALQTIPKAIKELSKHIKEEIK